MTATLAALIGAATGLILPRGPVTTGDALAVMVLGLLVGLSCGFVTSSRWAALVAPTGYGAAFELARIRASGPTVDGINLDTTYGVIALLVGRVFFALLVFFPMILGVFFGAAIARRALGRHPPDTIRARAGRYTRRIGAGLASAALLAAVVLIAQPASTPPIVGTDGQPVPGSISQLTTVRLGDREQSVMIRGYSTDNPVLLYLSGGPGGSDLPFSRAAMTEIQKHFILVGWDQPGSAKSYSALEPVSTLTLDQEVADVSELANYLRDRFQVDKVYLLGESWGSVLGVLAVQQHPEIFHAYVGVGQMVDLTATDRQLYREILEYAQRTNDAALTDQMRGFGPPPYDNAWAYGVQLSMYDKLEPNYEPESDNPELQDLGMMGLLGSEYNVMDKVNSLRGLLDAFAVLYPQARTVDFRSQVTRLQIPVYLVAGGHELAARGDLVPQWFEVLQAPVKRLYDFPDSAHAPHVQEAERFARLMTEVVLPETEPNR